MCYGEFKKKQNSLQNDSNDIICCTCFSVYSGNMYIKMASRLAQNVLMEHRVMEKR